MNKEKWIKRAVAGIVTMAMTVTVAAPALAAGADAVRSAEPTVTTTAAEKEARLNFFDAEAGTQAAEIAVKVPEAATTVDLATVKANLPSGYVLVGEQDAYDIGGGNYVYVEVKKVAMVEVGINFYYPEAEKTVEEGSIMVPEGTTQVNSSAFADQVPEGYALTVTGTYDINGGWIFAEVRKAEKTVKLNFYDEAQDKQIAEVEFTVPEDAKIVNTSAFTDLVPEGYEICETGDKDIVGEYVYVAIRKPEKTVKLNFYDEVQDKQIAEVEFTVSKDAKIVNTSTFADLVPEGYEICETGDKNIVGEYVYVAIRKAEQVVKVNYYDEKADKQIAEGSVTVAKSDIAVKAGQLTDIPAGYELVITGGEYAINDGYIYVPVRPEATVKVIKLNYYDEEAGKQVAEVEMEVPVDATHVNTSVMKGLPEGYEIRPTGDMAINDGYVYVRVVKVPESKVIFLNYYDEDQDVQVKEVRLVVPSDATSVNTSNIPAVEGYEIAITGDLPIRDGYVYVVVREVAKTQTVKVNYYDEAAEKQVHEETLTLSKDDTKINTSVLKEVPAGYELVEVGDLPIRDGYVYAAVRKVEVPTTQEVKINYYDEAAEKQIHEEVMTVAADATYVNTTTFKEVPAGYELVEVGDLPIRDGYVYAAVRKVEVPTTQEVKINYYDEAAEKQIHEEVMTVAADATYVNTTTFKEVPAGYELVEVGDLPIRDGYVYVAVRKVETPVVPTPNPQDPGKTEVTNNEQAQTTVKTDTPATGREADMTGMLSVAAVVALAFVAGTVVYRRRKADR